MSLTSYLPAYRSRSDWHHELQVSRSVQVSINKGKLGVTVCDKMI